MNINLTNKNALVCGSSRGIGKVVAFVLAELGAEITMVARSEKLLKNLCAKLPCSKDQNHQYLVVDFSNPDQLKQSLQQYTSKSNFHILVNNTGGPPSGSILKAHEEDFILAFKQHLVCNQILTNHVLTNMKKENYGRIVNIISTSVKTPLPNLGVSNTIRAAVANWAKSIANELIGYNITINNVLPGFTDTERLEQIVMHQVEQTGIKKATIEKKMIDSVPLRRFGKPEEIAAAVAFLVSPASSYIHGTNLVVDGGRTAAL